MKDKDKDRVNIFGQIKVIIMVIGKIIK